MCMNIEIASVIFEICIVLSRRLLLARDYSWPVTPVCVLINIARNSLRLTAQSDLHFIPWHICSFQHKLSFSVKHSSMLQFLREDFIHMFPVHYKQLCFIVTPRALGIFSLCHLHDMRSRNRKTININAGRFV